MLNQIDNWHSGEEYSDENISHNTSYNSAADHDHPGETQDPQLISFVYEHAGVLNAFHYTGGSGADSNNAPELIEEVEEEALETATRLANHSISMSSMRQGSQDQGVNLSHRGKENYGERN